MLLARFPTAYCYRVGDLTPEERAAINGALAGYLRDLEREFLDGVRTDYYVFQAGRLRVRCAPEPGVPGKVPPC